MKFFIKILLLISIFFPQYNYSQDGHFDSAYAILNLNDSGSNTWYDLAGNSGNPDFNDTDLGIFDLGSDDLKLIGTQHNMSKCNSCNITGSTMYYRIYTYGSASGGYTGVSTSWQENGWDGCGTQRWQNLSNSTNLLNGLGTGRYTIEIYSQASTNNCNGDFYDSNSGNNYKAHFRIATYSVGNGNWNSAGTWYNSSEPGNSDYVHIKHDVTITSSEESGYLKVKSGSSLSLNSGNDLTVNGDVSNDGTITLNSASSDFSSIIVTGSSSGNITYNRYVNSLSSGSGWDLIGSPVNNLQISSFASNNDTPLATGNGSGAGASGEYAIGTFDSSNNSWSNYTTANVGSDSFTPGKGYQMATDTGATLAFTGTVDTDATETISIQNYSGSSGSVWNLISNPYPSYISIGPNTTTDTFLEVNDDVIHATYVGVYGYDADNSNGSNYTIYNNTSSGTIAPGQGFFVAARSSSSANITFKEEMQSISGTDDFISGDVMENTEIELRIYNDNSSIGNTKIFFEENLTPGLDIGWDAGSFSQSDAIMTRLVEDDEGYGMAINAMGLDAMENAVVPLVINQSAGQEFRINLFTATIPDPNVYLEDVEEGTFTNLYEGDFVYTPTSDLSGVGRFFIHMSADTMSNEDVSTSMLNAFKEIDASYITIEGLATQTNETNVSLYNILGRKVLSTTLNNNMNTQTISTIGLSAGIYVIELESGSDRLTKKLIIK